MKNLTVNQTNKLTNNHSIGCVVVNEYPSNSWTFVEVLILDRQYKFIAHDDACVLMTYQDLKSEYDLTDNQVAHLINQL